jgi:hypothetical protein
MVAPAIIFKMISVSYVAKLSPFQLVGQCLVLRQIDDYYAHVHATHTLVCHSYKRVPFAHMSRMSTCVSDNLMRADTAPCRSTHLSRACPRLGLHLGAPFMKHTLV